VKKFLTVFVLVLLSASVIQAEGLTLCNSNTLDVLETRIRNEAFYGKAWSRIVARGTCEIDIAETTTFSVTVDWLMYTNTDGYVQMYFTTTLPSAFEMEIELIKDSLDRSWRSEVSKDQTYTWIGLTNEWIYERKDSQMNKMLSKLYTGLLTDNLTFISNPKISWVNKND